MTTAILPLVISLIICNTVFALMIKDTKFFQSKFFQSKGGRIFMLLPPFALITMLVWWFGFIFKQLSNYFKNATNMSLQNFFSGSSKLEQGLFVKKNVRRIEVKVEDFWGRGTFKARGSVEFEKDNTSAYQKFEGKTFDDVVIQIKGFLENLQ